MKQYPLDGVRIIDLTWAWAGPYATLLLSMMGAEVIKVESMNRLDHTRLRSLMTGPTMGGPDYSTVFNEMNLNKLSVTLDLKKPRAIEIVKEMVKGADIVAQNMRPGAIDRLGLSYEVLKEVKPDIIMLSSSAVGGTGPERTYVGYAPTFAAMGGLSYISGFPEDRPTMLSGVVDNRVATTSAFAVLAALNYRQRTGKGQHIDVSSTGAISSIMGEVLLDYTLNGRVTERNGNHNDGMVPHNCYPCRGENRWVTIAVSTEDEWYALCKVMGNPGLADDERFTSSDSRKQNEKALDRLIAEWTRQYDDYEATELLQEAGVAAAPSLNSKHLFNDPSTKERNIIVEVEHPKIGKRLVVAPPWKLSATPARIHHAAPLLGEHNQYVLGEILGMSQKEIDQLVEEQVVY